jgi:hypothetical protein
MMDDVYSQAVTLNQSFWSEADIDTRFKAGDQTLWNDIYGNLPAFRRKQFNFNRIRRVCNMITGYQRKHRKSLVGVPINNDDDQTATQLTKALMWSMRNANADDVISRCIDSGTITTGISLANVWLDTVSDPYYPDIKVDHVSYNEFLIDPYFKKLDLSDCNFVWRRKWMSKNALKGIFPGREDEIDEMHPRGNRDGKFQFMAEAYNYAMLNLLSYDEYWYRDFREATFVTDTQSGMAFEWEDVEDKLDEQLMRYPTARKIKKQIPTVKVAMLIDGKVFYHGSNPLQIDRYPFIPFIGYYEPELPYMAYRCQGVVRGLRDAQYLYNRRKVIELDIIESQINSGYKYKPDSLVNPKDIFMEGQGRGLALKQGADMGDVEKIMPPDVPPSLIQLSEILGREIQEISGVSDELLGMAEDDKAGILSMLRQGAGLTTLQILFDNMDFSQKLLLIVTGKHREA